MSTAEYKQTEEERSVLPTEKCSQHKQILFLNFLVFPLFYSHPVCMNMCPSLVLERFGIQEVSTVGRCPVNLNVPASKIGALQIGSRGQNNDFLEDGSYGFD
jgi:hypothetical protein